MANYTIITTPVQERILQWFALAKRKTNLQVIQNLTDNFLLAEQNHFLDDQDSQLIDTLETTIASSNLPAEDKELLKLKLQRRRP